MYDVGDTSNIDSKSADLLHVLWEAARYHAEKHTRTEQISTF